MHLQVAEERSLAGKCGNPLCDGSVQQRRAQGPRWQLAADTVAPETGALYCSAACNELVAQYAEALGDPMQVHTRTRICSHTQAQNRRTRM